MKKVLIITSFLLLLGAFSISTNTHASEREDNGTISKVDISTENSEVLDPVVAADGPEDGINDSSTVNFRLIKISDVPILPGGYKATPQLGLVSPMGAGEWDKIGNDYFSSRSKTFYSGGGDLMIEITQFRNGNGTKWLYKLMEEDPVWNDTVKSFELPQEKGTWIMKFDVRTWVDGDNNKAELYLEKLTYPLDDVYTVWYD